jgi:hypothetical protein
MILGTFTWRNMTIEADHLESAAAGPVTWLNRIDTGSAVWIAINNVCGLTMTNHAPQDANARRELEKAFKQFRAGVGS